MNIESLRPLANRLIDPLVAGAKRAGLTPNAVSLLALLVAGGAGASFYAARE